MKSVRTTARIHLLTAHQAPVAVIIRRKPSKRYHIIKWNLKTDQFEHGSWFSGKLYPMRCDLSWDGKHMVYLAKGSDGQDWNGLCEVPWLKTIADWDNLGTWNGGGIFWRKQLLLRNLAEQYEIREQEGWNGQYNIDALHHIGRSEDLPFVYLRLHRDGWQPLIDGKQAVAYDAYACPLVDIGKDLTWDFRSDENRPRLRTRYVGYAGINRSVKNAPEYAGRSGYVFHFELDDHPDLLGSQVEWATWTYTGDLIWTRDGVVYRMTPQQLAKGRPPHRYDFEDSVPPVKVQREVDHG